MICLSSAMSDSQQRWSVSCYIETRRTEAELMHQTGFR